MRLTLVLLVAEWLATVFIGRGEPARLRRWCVATFKALRVPTPLLYLLVVIGQTIRRLRVPPALVDSLFTFSTRQGSKQGSWVYQ